MFLFRIFLFLMMMISISSSAQNKRAIKIGVGASHLFDLYEGPLEKNVTIGNVNYNKTDIDLKGLNGDYSNFDLGLTVLIELKINQNTSLTSSYTKGTMTSQFDNQYAISDLDILNVGYRRYFNFYSDSSRARLFPFVDLSAGLTLYTAERNFVKDQSLFSRTESSTINTSISAGCLINLNRKISIIAAPNFIVNYSDAIDGYENQGVDIMLSSTIALIYKLKI
tara:strand:- start:3644 stop:4315 length:672 start_codon:yes stop_codon:yes gene_type:complete